MTNHLMEEVTDESTECFYLFLDTNLFYSEKVTYNIFKIKLMKDLLDLRDSFNILFNNYRKIEILIPKLVVEEIYSIKSHVIQSEISKFQKTIKHLDEKSLIDSLEKIYDKVHFELDKSGEHFFSNYDIEMIPYCDNKYFPTIIDKSINKRLPFKPEYNDKKKRHVGDNGFKDAVIWYSIINHVEKKCNKNTDHIFFLTNNEKDFRSELTLLEFKELTGKNIEIIKFKSTDPNVNDSEFNPFLKNILNKSNVHVPIKLEQVNISYLDIKNAAEINSIIAEPLSININSVVNCKKRISNLDNENKIILNDKIKETLSEFEFDISDLKFNYYIPEIENVYFTLMNYMNESLDIDEIIITYKDGSEKHLLYGLNVYINPDSDYPIEFEENDEQFTNEALELLCNDLEENGYGTVAPEAIDFEYDDCDGIF